MVGRYALSLGALLALAACSNTSAIAGGEEDLSGFEPISAFMGNPPNYAQMGNGSAMSVVSRAWGRGAKAGALVELYYPHYNTDHLYDSFVGVRSRGQKLRWAHDLELKKQSIVRDTGLVVSELAGPGFAIRIEDVMRPNSDAHVRHVVVTNTGSAPLEDVDVDFYAYYMIGGQTTGDRIRYDAETGTFVQTDDAHPVAIATRADRAPRAAHCGHGFGILPGDRDATAAAESAEFAACRGLDPALTGVNAVFDHRLGTIAPGASSDITYAIGIAASAARAEEEAAAALDGGFAARAKEDADHWAAELARATRPAALPADAEEVYDRALITILQHRVDNGAFVAASTLNSPVYKLIWPRDGSKTAIDMLEAGYAAEAKSFFELLETLLLPDGSFAINYKSDGSGPYFDFGRAWNENDQPGMLAWGVNRVLAMTGDRAWAAARWPAVRRASEHLLEISEGGLVLPSRDLWELETGSSWTYANASAVAGLEGAAEIARVASSPADADRYVARAAEIRRQIDAQLVTEQGFYARGIKNGRVDDRLEIANLALGVGGFGLIDDNAPALARVGDLVASRLGTPGGAVRRYEGDAYYGGHPWPVASAWLSLHRAARGDRAEAVRLFDVMTRQAHATDSAMLGEQFDEGAKVWQSAFPLVWSEAAYVRTALALYGARPR